MDEDIAKLRLKIHLVAGARPDSLNREPPSHFAARALCMALDLREEMLRKSFLNNVNNVF